MAASLQQDLRYEHERFRVLVEHSLDPIVLLNATGGILYSSNAVETILGYSVGEFVGRNIFDFIHPDDLPARREVLQKLVSESGGVTRGQFRCRHRSGKWLWLECLGHNLLHRPEIGAIACALRDVTDAKEAVLALEQNRTFLRHLIEVSPCGIIQVDATGQGTPMNGVAKRFFEAYDQGEDRHNVKDHGSRTICEDGSLCDPDEYPVTETLATGRPAGPKTIGFKQPNGGIYWAVFTSVPLFEPDGALGGAVVTFADITDRKNAEDRLRESEERFQMFMQHTPALAWIKDEHFRYAYVNRAFENTFKVSAQEMQGAVDADYLPEHTCAELRRNDAIVLSEWRELQTTEVVPTPDGEEREWVTYKFPFRSANGAAWVAGLALDLTASRKTQEALRTAETIYESLVEHIPQSIFRKDCAGRFTFANSKFCQTLHKRPGEILSKTDFDLFPPELATKYQADDRTVLQSATTLESVEKHRHPDGKESSVRVIKSPLFDARGDVIGLQGIFWDITEQQELELQLRRAQKMEAVGHLAGGIAHEFNNILTIVQGYASLLQIKCGNLPEVAGPAEHIIRAAQRASNLTLQLLTFSRKQLFQPRALDLSATLSQVAQMLRPTLGTDIEVIVEPGPPLPLAMADPSMIEQIIVNLALNARDAMPNGGVLKFSTATAIADEATARAHETKPGVFVQLTVHDSGGGISELVMPHIFDPFFTTKEVGKGTGLGLATVYGIVKQHHGWVSVSSCPGAGTTFHIFLPVFETATAAPVQDDPRIPQQTHPRSEGAVTILVVDDEPVLRSFIREVLEHAGYAVFEAGTGEEGLQVWTQHQAEIDLMLTDIVMPGSMKGWDLARALQQKGAAIPIIFSSGYSAETLRTEFELIEGRTFLQKPYPPSRLIAALQAALNSAAKRT